MAENRIIQLILKAKDEATAVLSKAESGIESFGQKAAGMFKAVAALATAAVLGKFFKDSIGNALEAEKSIARLDAALRTVGSSYKQVEPEVERYLETLQRTTRYSDEDGREALTRLVAMTGNYQQSLQDMQVVADLASFKQIDLAEAAGLVAKAHEGSGRELKAFGIEVKAGVDAVPQLAAKLQGFEANSRTLGDRLKILNNHWEEFKERVGAAMLGTTGVGESVDKLTGFLVKLEDWTTRNSDRISGFTGLIFKLGGVIKDLTGGAFGLWDEATTKLALRWQDFKHLLERIGPTFMLLVGSITEGIGELAQRANPLLKHFGIELGSGMAEAGRKMTAQAKADLNRMAQDHSIVQKYIIGLSKNTVTAVAGHAKSVVTTTSGAVAAVGKATGDTMTNLRTSVVLAFGELEARVADATIRLASPRLKDATASLEGAIRKIGDGWVYVDGTWVVAQQHMEEGGPSVAGIASEAAKAADAFLAVAQAIGLADEKTTQLVTGIADVADAIGMVASGNLAGGLAQGISGLSGVISGLFGGESESARQVRLALELTRDKLEQHRRTLGDLIAISQPGAKVTNLAGGIQGILDEDAERKKRGGVAKDLAVVFDEDIRRILAPLGLTLEDLEDLAKDLGIDLRLGGPNVLLEQLRAVLDDLAARDSGFAQTFTGQMDRLIGIWEIVGADAGQKLGDIVDLATGEHGSDLFDPIKNFDLNTKEGRDSATAFLEDLFKRDDLTNDDLGGLNLSQFRDLILEIVGLFREVNSSGAHVPRFPGGQNAGVGGPTVDDSVPGEFGDAGFTDPRTGTPSAGGEAPGSEDSEAPGSEEPVPVVVEPDPAFAPSVEAANWEKLLGLADLEAHSWASSLDIAASQLQTLDDILLAVDGGRRGIGLADPILPQELAAPIPVPGAAGASSAAGGVRVDWHGDVHVNVPSGTEVGGEIGSEIVRRISEEMARAWRLGEEVRGSVDVR